MSSSVLLLLIAIPPLLLTLLTVVLRERKKTQSLQTRVIGAIGFSEKNLDPEGAVIVNGELFRARLSAGAKISGPARIRVIGAQDHLLIVEPAPRS